MTSETLKQGVETTASPDVSPRQSQDAATRNHPTIDHPEDLEGKTLFEKKCVLINREIDSMGMGKYQWFLWGLCGFGYLLDLLWAQAFGLVLAPLTQELNIQGKPVQKCRRVSIYEGQQVKLATFQQLFQQVLQQVLPFGVF
jgi:hypothetical protein